MLELTEKEIIEKWDPKDTIKVSICCITYNQEMYIKRALDSFLTQNTSFPFEIIIGDDASSDNTSKILDEYAKNYPKLITVISSPKNIGANANLLQVFNAAQGDYIALCEGDDFWCSEDKISIQYNTMLMDKNISFSFHSAYINKTLSPIKYTKNKSYFTVEDIIKNSQDQFCPTASYMFKRNVVKVLPPWFKNASIGDYYIEIYSLTLGVGLYIDKPMCVYQQMAVNSWSASISNNLEKLIKSRSSIIEHDYLTKKDFPLLKSLIDDRICRTYYIIAKECLLKKEYAKFDFYLNKLKNKRIPSDIKNNTKLFLFFRKKTKKINKFNKNKN
ncbi:Undecaprenyl-phosphate 4-deoxy-4-formamido-L-arabinose transferase [Providencia manganoxydans]|uniref:glycosyltransferase n=1 Tax=Providencia manganoxydans TaxID=2923283 RepID=UPI003DA1A6BB